MDWESSYWENFSESKSGLKKRSSVYLFLDFENTVCFALNSWALSFFGKTEK